MEPTVELRDITKVFDDVTAVEDLSVKVRPGEFFSLLGPSGCGKTTTLRLIGGFETPTKGQILIKNKNVTDKRPYQRNVNTVFQNYALFPHLTVAGNIAFGLERKKVSRKQILQRIESILELVRLEGMESRYPRQLSGGQQQRVALARALVLRPDVLLLDEPLGALDLKLRKDMQLELKSLQEKVGITFIYVTHDQEEALTMSDHIAVMEKGRLVQAGTPEDIYNLPRTRFVAEFIGVSNLFSGRVIEHRQGDLLVETGGGLKVALATLDNRTKGEALNFSIRPEKISLMPETREDDRVNRFQGEIVNKIFLGGSVSYRISLSAEEQITVEMKNEPRSDQPISLSPGDRVTVSWHADDCIILLD